MYTALWTVPPEKNNLAWPVGTVTFLLTDIEGSTRLWEQHPDAMRAALARHDLLAAEIVARHAGILVKQRGEGDSLFTVFGQARDAVAAAVEVQRAFTAEPWPAETPLRVRMALHTGDATVQDGDYVGPAVNRCARLRAIAHAGQVLLSQTTHDLVQEELPPGVGLRDLGLHRLRDLQSPEHVFQLLHTDLPADFPALPSLDTVPNNLPQQVTSFIGRQREMREIRDLAKQTRLLTLTGSGGTGKSRLALQIAAELLPRYTDGAWLVELAALYDPALLPQRVAGTLSVREEPGRSSVLTLVGYLRTKHLLLVLDNCEHLLPACAELVDALLRSCPDLHILATSRERLGLTGEATYRVPSLSLPEPGVQGRTRLPTGGRADTPPPEHLNTRTPEDLMQFEAIRLFCERAAFARPGYHLTPPHASAVVQICQRLDGIPLAIELAAARTRMLSEEQIVERLDDRFRLLTEGSRTALPRQQTLRATLDWSYELLTEAERVLLRRLSIFAASWSLEAAEAVCADDEVVGRCSGDHGQSERPQSRPVTTSLPHHLATDEVLLLLGRLVDKSLVIVEEPRDREVGNGWAVRYRLLETVRQYARERLVESGEADEVAGRHRDWFWRFAEESDQDVSGGEGGVWLEPLEQATRARRLEIEHDNLRVALEWSLSGGRSQKEESRREDRAAENSTVQKARLPSAIRLLPSDAEAALRLAGALGWFWQTRGYWSEGRDRLGAALAASGSVSPVWRARALRRVGQIAGDLCDYPAARRYLEEAAALSKELGDLGGTAQALHHLGWVLYRRGDHAAADAVLKEALEINRCLGREEAVAMTLSVLGWVACGRGDYGASRALFEQHLAISRELGNKASIALVLNSLGYVTQFQGEYAASHAFLKDSLALHLELDHRPGIAACLNSLGRLAWLEDDLATARALVAQCLPLALRAGYKQGIVTALGILAGLAATEGQPERAAQLFGAAEKLHEEIGSPMPAPVRAHYDLFVPAARAALGEERFAAARGEGRAMMLTDAIAAALESYSDGAQPSPVRL